MMTLPPSDSQLLCDEAHFGHLARIMLHRHLIPRGITDPAVLRLMRTIPRHLFVAPHLRHLAYEDQALKTLNDQTISQPFIVAFMTQLLDLHPEHRVLEIGTGSGYQTLILSRLAHHITSIERDPALAQQAADILRPFLPENLTLKVGDGTLGYPPNTPYDRILVTAAAPAVPPALREQLADLGRIIIPIGSRHDQHLHIIDRQGSRFIETPSIAVRFVPLIGDQGWQPEDD